MNKIKIMRKRVHNLKWLERKLWKIADDYEKLQDFKKFECSDFFRGRMKAELNREYYNKEIAKLYRQEDFIKSRIKALKK